MKKVCMITHDAPYIDRRILLQAKCLVQNGYDVTIVYPFGEINSDFDGLGIKYDPINPKVNIKNSLSSTKKFIRKILPQKLYIFLKMKYFDIFKTDFIDYEEELIQKSIEKQYDIYVAHDLPALPIAHFAAKKYNAKLVYDAHEFFLGQIALQGKRKKFFDQLEKKYIYDVDLMFTVNDDIANLFKEKYGIDKITVIYNSIEKREILKKDLHQILQIPKKIKIILYQGGFLEDRNLEILVKSAKYLDENIVLVMLGYSFLENKLKQLAIYKGVLNKKVFFMQRVPQKELLNYTAGADFGIIPYPAIDLNTKYCTPNKMFEFVSAKVPIIANKDLVTVVNILKKYNIGEFIAFDNEKEIANNINKIVNSIDVEKAKEKIEKVQKYFTWEYQEKLYLSSFSKL